MHKCLGVLAMILTVGNFAQAASADAAAKSVAVLDIVGSGVAPELLPTLTEILITEIAHAGQYKVIGGRDIQAMMGFEKQKDVLGCTDASCLAEIGGALGVERIVASQIGRVGSTYVVNIKLINIRTAATEGRVYETVKGEDDVLIETVRRSVQKLFGATAPKAQASVSSNSRQDNTASPSSTPQAEVQQTGQSSFPLGPVLVGGAGVVGIAIGAIFGVTAKSKEEEALAGQPHSQIAAQSAQENASRSNIFLGVGGAALVGGVVWFLLSGDDSPEATAWTPLLGPNSVGVAYSSSF